MAKISLVAPVYGVEKYIHQFLDSITNQTFDDYELILVDDGSKDNCPQILDEYAQSHEKARVIHQPNGGVSVARNTGLKEISGEYVYIIDSDDWLESTALESLWKAAEETKADIIYGDWVSEGKSTKRITCFPTPFVTEDIETISKLQYAVNSDRRVKISSREFDHVFHLGGAPWRGMFKASIIKDNQVFFDPYVKGLGDDILFTLHIYEYVHKVAYIQEVLYHYREMLISYTKGYKENYLESVARVFEKQEDFLKEYHKTGLAYQAFYLRVLIYLEQGMKRYFCNTNNPRSKEERLTEFKDTLRKEPYRTAVKKITLKYFYPGRFMLSIIALKLHLYSLYWKLRG